MKAYVFPGQGSQKKGMGETLFDTFGDLVKQADDILGYSIKELCLANPDQKLNETQYTQPALYVVNALTYLAKIQADNSKPDFLAGHSLGEYNALHAAGAMSFADGLKLVQKRGELMSKATQGAMAAIIHMSHERIQRLLEQAGLDTIDIANLNAPSQIVISGSKQDIINAQPWFEKEKAVFIPLNTSGAFHSRYMQEAQTQFADYIEKFSFSSLEIPVISNVTARPYVSEEVAKNLIDQVTRCVRWSESIFYLLAQGEMEFEEMGVGNVLTKLIGHIKKEWDAQQKPGEATAEKNAADEVAVSAETAEAAESTQTTKALETSAANDPHDMVARWNKMYPIGTRVSSVHYDSPLETRTEAMVLFGCRAAVYMKDYNGYFDLREVTPVEE